LGRFVRVVCRIFFSSIKEAHGKSEEVQGKSEDVPGKSEAGREGETQSGLGCIGLILKIYGCEIKIAPSGALASDSGAIWGNYETFWLGPSRAGGCRRD
jgi:hypothetical protein